MKMGTRWCFYFHRERSHPDILFLLILSLPVLEIYIGNTNPLRSIDPDDDGPDDGEWGKLKNDQGLPG